MKTKTDNNGVYTISQPMMNCFKQLLFSANGGVNLQGIVDDLTFGQNNDLVACAVAFAYKGIKPEIDKTIRYEHGWQSYYAYEAVDFSVINNAYKCVRKLYEYDKETSQFVYKSEEEGIFPAETIDCLETSFNLAKVRGMEK